VFVLKDNFVVADCVKQRHFDITISPKVVLYKHLIRDKCTLLFKKFE
jgi:hypothetical protein